MRNQLKDLEKEEEEEGDETVEHFEENLTS